MSGGSLLYSPTPMKRRSEKRLKSPRRHAKYNIASLESNDSGSLPELIKDENNCEVSLSSKLGSTVATADIESDSDSECDASFFCEKIPESASQAEEDLVKPSHDDQSKKSGKKKKKKKKKEKYEKTEKKKKKREKSEKSEKKKKKREKSGKKKKREKRNSSSKCAKEEISKERSLFDALEETAVNVMEQSHSDSDDSWESNYVVPQIQNQEELQQLPYGPPIWGDKEEMNSFGDAWDEEKSGGAWDEEKSGGAWDEEKSGGAWEEEKSWSRWEESKDAGEEYIEESICDDISHDGSHDAFSYYTVQSNDEFGFPEDYDIDDDDIEDDAITDWDEESECPDSGEDSGSRRVRFSEIDTVYSTLHICDFTRGEINRSWYQQNDYEETIQSVKEVASNSESPQDSQKRRRKQRLLLSKPPDTRGLEAWTPSGVQRFRYVKEAAFRAVWDEQQKQLDRLDEKDEDGNSVDLTENIETLREAYQRVSMRSQKEAQERAKKDEEIAEKLRPRLGALQRGAIRRNSLLGLTKSIGSSSRKLLDRNSSHDLSDSPAAPPSCLRKPDNSDEIVQELDDDSRKRVWFRDSARRLAREKSDNQKPGSERGLFKQSSDRALFKKKSDGGLFRESSDRSLFKKKQLDRGLFRQSSDRSLFRRSSLFKQSSDRSLFKKASDFGPITEEEYDSSDMAKGRKSSSALGSIFAHKPSRRSSDGMLSGLKLDRRDLLGLSRQNSVPALGEKS